MLEQLGYETYAVSGALDVIKSKDFDLVISDIVMPGGMDGRRWPALSEHENQRCRCFLRFDAGRFRQCGA